MRLLAFGYKLLAIILSYLQTNKTIIKLKNAAFVS